MAKRTVSAAQKKKMAAGRKKWWNSLSAAQQKAHVAKMQRARKLGGKKRSAAGSKAAPKKRSAAKGGGKSFHCKMCERTIRGNARRHYNKMHSGGKKTKKGGAKKGGKKSKEKHPVAATAKPKKARSAKGSLNIPKTPPEMKHCAERYKEDVKDFGVKKAAINNRICKQNAQADVAKQQAMMRAMYGMRG